MINKLEICGLTKRFGEKTLFEDLDLTLAEPAVLWAPSGWGKTTLLRILMELEAPDSGTVQGVGRVGAVFQEDRLCPQLTAAASATVIHFPHFLWPMKPAICPSSPPKPRANSTTAANRPREKSFIVHR